MNSSSEPGDFEILPDGSIICSIWHKGACQLAKFTADGDSIWSRGYVVYTWVGGSENMPYDIDPTSDGGFVVCGETEQGTNDPTPGLQTMFLIKTDSLGCVVPGCHLVGVQEYAMELQEHLKLWPNPATDHLRLELELPAGIAPQGAVQAVLLDATGREVLRERVRQNGNLLSHALTLTPFPPGLYHLHLADEKRWLAGGRVVVE
ncbi:MAG: hypothetical protein GFGODING_02108 [Flavobacteriales bacterium]|nr:hypothetical protein [Flavobacteriales bacterium]